MQTKTYVTLVFLLCLLAIIFYVTTFHEFAVSKDPEDWAQLGDYIGGVLNPVLSFVSILLLVHSLSLQRLANEKVQDQVIAANKTEEFRSFESKFFRMIEAQDDNFRSLRIYAFDRTELEAATAIIWIEDKVEHLRAEGASEDDVRQFLQHVDDRDQLFGLLRGFYVTVKFVVEGLSDAKGFSQGQRISEVSALINFSDFSLVRLYKMLMQFMDYYPAEYLNSCAELDEVMAEVGLDSVSY